MFLERRLVSYASICIKRRKRRMPAYSPTFPRARPVSVIRARKPPVIVRRYSPEGEFLGVVGCPSFTTGCVRVTIEVSADQQTV